MVDYLQKRVVVRKKLRDNTWTTETNGFVLKDTKSEKVAINLGKSRDSFNFSIRNPNNTLYENFYSGNGSTVGFTIAYSPIPTEHLSGKSKKFNVYIGGLLKAYTTDYTVSSSTLTFTTAPASGDRNIRIVYSFMESDDLVDIYLWKNASFDSLTTAQKNTARKIEGQIIEPTVNKGENVVSVKGYGLIDTIFSGMAFAQFDPDTVNRAHLAIQQIISQLNKFNPNRTIYGQDAAEWTALGNDTSTGVVQYNSKYRTAIEMIEELSGDKYTGNGQYIYYVVYNGEEDRYEFKWKAKTTESSGTITEGTDANMIKMSRSTEDVINVVIFNAGNDCYGNGQEYLNYDFTINGFGAKWKYVSETSTISQALINAEFESNTALWDTGDNNERTENFPVSYPYTFQYTKARGVTGIPTGSNIIASNDKGFNKTIRDESEWIGKFWTDRIIRLYSNPRYVATLFIPYHADRDLSIGNMYTIDMPCFGLNGKKLRLIRVTHEFTGVNYEFEEDETTVLL